MLILTRRPTEDLGNDPVPVALRAAWELLPPVPIISPCPLHRPALWSLNRISEEYSEPELRLRGWCEGVPEFASTAIGAGTALSSTASRLLHLILSLLLHSFHLVQNMRI